MDLRRLQYFTEKQFNKCIEREGREVEEFYSKNKYQVILRGKSSTSTQRNILVYYKQGCGLGKGDTITYRGENYLLINENLIESEVYCVSAALMCTALFNVNGDLIPFVVGDLSGGAGKMGTGYGNDRTGNITLMTSEVDLIKNIINYKYRCFGGNYQVINHFFNDGIAYIYITRIEDSTDSDPFALKYYGSSNGIIKIEDGKQLLKIGITQGNVIISDAKIYFKSSNIAVATVDEFGYITPKKKGSCVVTVTYPEGNLTEVLSLTTR